MLLALRATSALAAPPTQAEAHALVAGSAVTLWDGATTERLGAGVVLDYARLQGVLRHDTEDDGRVGVQVQLEALNDPALLDALATYAPSDRVSVEVGLQRTWLSEMFDVLVPIQVLRDRTAPEGIAPGRRTGAQVVLGAREGRGTRVHVGAWAPEGWTGSLFQRGVVSALVEHQTDADLVLHGGLWSTPDKRAAGSGWAQGFDAAVGYEPDGTRLVVELAGSRSNADWHDLGGTIYASHRLEGRTLEPAGFLDYYRLASREGTAGGIAGARAGLTVHLVDKHAQWTSDLGVSMPVFDGELGTLRATAGTRLMVGF